ncbi:DUF4761 family protein [Escherichia coli]|nr:DUF4761 family protein [Escherichia coli]
MKQQRNARIRNTTERHVAYQHLRKSATSATTEIHATPDGRPVTQTGKHTWTVDGAGIVIHKSLRSPVTGRFNFSVTRGDDYFGQDFTFFEALRTVDRLMTGRNFHAN